MFQFVRIIFVILFIFNCANVFSPTGIKGEQAKKKIEEHRSNLSFLSISNLLMGSTASPSSNPSSLNYSCPTENAAVLGFSGPTTTANFSLPQVGAYIDLSVTSSGTSYFRSNPSFTNTLFVSKILKTESTSANASCYYTTTSVCGTTDLSMASIGLLVDSTISVSPGTCLAIKCSSPAYIRMKQYSVETVSNFLLDPILSVVFTPVLFESLSGINDDTYYTLESYAKCKKEITNFALIELQYSNYLSALLKEISSCNKPNAAIQAATLNPSLTASLQADACKLEPVNALGY
ncbi:hypothetical protein [Leptospira harrisiae]|uniref:Uncharacterized protein n=2 Tax=Leptospira harrisiae TaxID=2023189 RepID=A0A2N0AQ33_9LEPT|nr:hypothetical protein [Leptospira harrisiae]PJZ86399.1 hypothetical protein CH364_09620 [Leptospira harrisiae]PKA09964.1 hypothetical protein CH366_09890 [Leptospira harrisiae]